MLRKFLSALVIPFALNANVAELSKAPGAIVFTPPAGWSQAEETSLPKYVLAMVIGKGTSNFPPSINLAYDYAPDGLQEYMKVVRQLNDAKGIPFKDLGTIRTQAGDARLLQLDLATEQGTIREMQVIYNRGDTAYILTAAALKDEFSTFYKDFFTSLRSLNVNRTLMEMIPDKRRQLALENYRKTLLEEWVASSEKSPEAVPLFKGYIEFCQKIGREFSDMSEDWRQRIETEVKDMLTKENQK